MDPHQRPHSYLHRQSLRPVGGSMASRYGISSGSSTPSGSATGVGVGLSSSVVSFMRKFVSKASPSANSIDSSFEKYHRQQQMQQKSQSPTKYSSLSTGVAFDQGAAHFGPPHPFSDTGYSSNANSPVTTPTVCSSSISTSPVPPPCASNLNTCSPTLSLGSLASLGSTSFYQTESGSSRPSSSLGATTVTASGARGPFFSKIRAKMASTFQSTGPSGGQHSQQSSTSSSPLHSRPESAALEGPQGGKPRSSSITSATYPLGAPDSSASATQRPPKLSMIASSSSSLTNEQLTAHLTDEEKNILQKVFQKEEEFREIALKNFSKNVQPDPADCASSEETASAAPASSASSGPLLLTSSPVSGVAHLSANLLDPVAAAVHRRRSSAVMSADATGLCRICRKVIMKNESAHRCSNCRELVCDDCSSYSSREESKYWMCSFCRRRGSHLILNPAGLTSTVTSTSPGPAITSMPKSPLYASKPESSTYLAASANNTKRKLSYSECIRPNSSLELHSARQSSLDLQKTPSIVVSSGLKPSQAALPPHQPPVTSGPTNGPECLYFDSAKAPPSESGQFVPPDDPSKTPASGLSPNGNNARPRIYSLSDDEEFLSDDEDEEDEELELEDEEEEEANLGEETFRAGGASGEESRYDPFLQESHLFAYASGKKRARKLRKGNHTSSGSPHKEYSEYGEHYGHQVGGPSHGTLASVPVETLKRQRSTKKKKKKVSQQSLYNSDDELINYSGNKEDSVFEPSTCSATFGAGRPSADPVPFPSGPHSTLSYQPYPSMASSAIARIISPKPSRQVIASKWVRLSRKAGSFSRTGCPESFYGKQQRSSESSDISDFRYSPPQDSLTPSSEYSRSPRESADSEMLGLTYCSLTLQRRSIPSVLVDVGDGTSHYLSTKDCYARRGSTGRALPKIPVEPSRSMLDLPHSRKSSQHSLDIPMEQPRRASAPEGENIRIVIDEVSDVVSSQQDLRAEESGGPVQVSAHQTSYQQRVKYQLTRAASIVTHYERVVLQRDRADHSSRTRGFGLAVVGGKLNESDGMLYAFVSWVKPGETADKTGLKTGDKILEWCGKSLVNCSYEQACHIMDTGGDSVELIVESMVKCDPQQHKRRQSLAHTGPTPPTGPDGTSTVHEPAASVAPSKPAMRPSSAAAVVSTSALGPSTHQCQPPPTLGISPRRRLPQIPPSPHPPPSNLLPEAQMLLQVTLDSNIRQLSVMIVSARGLEQHPSFSPSSDESLAQLRLLPEMGFKVCQTELSSEFEWNETLIYHQFPLEKVDSITLELSVWSGNPHNCALYSPHPMPGPQISVASEQVQLASTRIPLRSALFRLSQWWPLIPTDPASSQAPPISSADPTIPPMFFNKMPSMDFIDVSSHTLLADPVLMSRSTPGSRRNSGRGDAAELMEMVGANQARSDSLQPQVGGGRLCTPPTRASSTLSASTGRHSLDDSSCSTSAAKSLSLGRSTSLRLVANRHSVANLYHVPPGCVPNSRLAAPVLDPAMMRRKSSSALGAPHKPPDAGISYQDAQAHYRRSGSLHASSQHYCRLDADSRQYLLAQNEPAAELSEQDSELSSDDDVDCLLAHSDYTLDSADSKPFAEQKGVEVRVETASASDPPLASLHQLTVLDSNRLAIADADSRYSGTTTPVTPSHEGEGEEEGGTLAVPAWVSSERRGSFLRRLVPAAAESVMNMMGQSAPRGDPAEAGKQAVVVGEIKLGFIMTKGFLEIEVIGARDLPDSVNGPFPPDTYVKTYLYDRGRQLYKRKTHVVVAERNPQYRQTLKYDASIIYGRTLLVSVWEKQKKTFDSNSPVGATEINVNQLELHKLTIRWYRLRRLVSPKDTPPSLPEPGPGPPGATGRTQPQ